MARLARIVAAGCPHYVTQRGTRRRRAFRGAADYGVYCRLVAAYCALAHVKVLSRPACHTSSYRRSRICTAPLSKRTQPL